MIAAETLAVACGLGSALAWGAGDFVGGLASRRSSALIVVLFSQLVGGGLLLGLAVALGGNLPPARQMVFGALAGVFGVLGLVGLYEGLAQGRMGLVAPLSAVVTVLVPLLFSLVVEGFPGWLRMVGFAIAVVAVPAATARRIAARVGSAPRGAGRPAMSSSPSIVVIDGP